MREKKDWFPDGYWKEAAVQLRSTRMLIFAALIVALRVAVKLFRIQIATGVSLTFDCYVNSMGSMVYGPVMALLVGAVSDTLGCMIAPSGVYFFPFIFVEMSSSFLFALFFWHRKITVTSTVFAKFTVNFISNIVLTSLIMKWDYWFLYGTEKAYPLFNMVRIVKNLVLFPFEGILIVIVLHAIVPVFRRMRILPADQENIELEKKHISLVILLLLLSVALILFYIFFLRDFLKAHNITFF